MYIKLFYTKRGEAFNNRCDFLLSEVLKPNHDVSKGRFSLAFASHFPHCVLRSRTLKKLR
jgi:hypothetical protein